MEYKQVFNDTKRKHMPNPTNSDDLQEDQAGVEVYTTVPYSTMPGLLRFSHGNHQLEDLDYEWHIVSGNRELAIREAIERLDAYELGRRVYLEGGE